MKHLCFVLLMILAVVLTGAYPSVAATLDAAGPLVAQDDSFDGSDDAIDVGEDGDFNIDIDEPLGFDPDEPFGQMSDEDAEKAAQGFVAVLMGMMAVVMVFAVIGLIIAIVVYYLFYTCAASIPTEHQQVAPGMVWLMLIPCVNLVMAFIVFPKIAAGFKSYFDAQGRTDVGDCGQQLALFYAISIVCCIVPYLNMIAGIAALVLMIVLLVKFMGYKNEILAGGAA